MIAGMTPCTSPWHSVVAIMNATYQIELAGKLYYLFNICIYCADENRQVGATNPIVALLKIEQNTIPSAGITANLIYVNSQAIGWRIPVLQQLPFPGVPNEGLNSSAGAPSIEVASE